MHTHWWSCRPCTQPSTQSTSFIIYYALHGLMSFQAFLLCTGLSHSSSSISIWELVHDSPLWVQDTPIEHFSPAFLQLQVAVMQPLRHLHEIIFGKLKGMESLFVVIGATSFSVTFQPDSVLWQVNVNLRNLYVQLFMQHENPVI